MKMNTSFSDCEEEIVLLETTCHKRCESITVISPQNTCDEPYSSASWYPTPSFDTRSIFRDRPTVSCHMLGLSRAKPISMIYSMDDAKRAILPIG
mmetsp:Transcript_1305/g.1532  ORF Transcript_1305/g.1532 Transcript_1305/m.1532 type:complete len:95 (-) Transcript_1305:231-515(-)